VEDKGNACSPLFGLGERSADPFIGLAEEGLIEFSLPFVPKLPALCVKFMLLWREGIQSTVDRLQ